MRVVSLYLPDWPIERLARARLAAPEKDGNEQAADRLLVLAQRIGSRRQVYAANTAAKAAGVRPGMAVAQAQALVPELGIQDAETGSDAVALDKLGLWALRLYSPLVAVDLPDGLVVDVTGAAHLCGGEDRMLSDMVSRLAKFGITARAAMADSWGAAYAFARASSKPTFVAPPGESPSLLHRLPIAFLRLPDDLVTQLRRLGFERINDISSQPRAPLARRFGPDLHRRLDQALGRLREPIEPIRSPALIEARRQFAEPIGAAETLARYTGKLVEALCEQLVAKGVGACFLILLRRFHGVCPALARRYSDEWRQPHAFVIDCDRAFAF